MYGDCQVMQQSSSSMMMGASVGGVGSNMNMSMPVDMNMNIPLDPIFTMENPNQLTTFMTNLPPFHSFSSSIIPKDEMVGAMRKELEELDQSVSGSGQVDGLSYEEEPDTTEHEQNQNQQEPLLLDANGKKKRYHRHTVRQIHEMEALFKECPHPDDKQRMRLSQELGLKPRQVKFWFQNRRTQMKAQQDRADNVILRAENESLKGENFRLQAAMGNLACPNCGGPAILGEMSFDEQNLRVENARLKDELDRLSCIAARYTGQPITTLGPAPPLLLPSLDLDMGIYSRNFNQPNPNQFNDSICEPKYFTNTDTTFVREEDKHMVIDMSISAAKQLVRMCRTNEPLWVNKEGTCGGEVMNLQEHGKMFPSWGMNLEKKDMRLEATRDRGHVMMNSVTLVDAFLDVNKWADLFPSMVSNAKTLQVITPNLADNGNGSLHLMYAELQVLSPLVPTREAYFFRYCQHNVEEGFWVIVDFDADGLIQEGFQINANRGYKRRPSGFIFQDTPNGYSMVTWVEQAEVEAKPVHQIFDHFVTSGAAFGATRWLAVLQHQCNRLASLMARNVSDLGVIPSADARKNMMRLSLRMIKTFCSNICSSVSIQPWTALSDSSNDTIRITTRKNSEAGQPNGVILSAVSTTWLPFSHLQVFELLTDENRRSQLDVLSGGNSLHEVAHIANGSHHKNCVSLFRINASSNSSQNVELLLQESSTHPSGGSLVVYTTIDVDSVQVAMSGEDPSYIPLLPNGFVVVPSPSPTANGCLLTVGLQVLASAIPSAKLNLSSVTAINNHLSNAVDQIRTSLENTDVSVANTVLLEN